MHPGGPPLVRRRESCPAWSCPPHRGFGEPGWPRTPPPAPIPCAPRALTPPPHPLVTGRTLHPPTWVGVVGGGRGTPRSAARRICTHPTHRRPGTLRPIRPPGAARVGGGHGGARQGQIATPRSPATPPHPHRPGSDRPTSTPARPDAGVGTGSAEGEPPPAEPPAA